MWRAEVEKSHEQMAKVASIESDKAECRCLQAPMLVLARREELRHILESSRTTFFLEF